MRKVLCFNCEIVNFKIEFPLEKPGTNKLHRVDITASTRSIKTSKCDKIYEYSLLAQIHAKFLNKEKVCLMQVIFVIT